MRRLVLAVAIATALTLFAVPAIAAKSGLTFRTTVSTGFATGTATVYDLRLIPMFEPSIPGTVYCFTYTIAVDPIVTDTSLGTLVQEPPTYTNPGSPCYTVAQLQQGITLDCAAGTIVFNGTGSQSGLLLWFRDSEGNLQQYGAGFDLPTLTAEPGSKEAREICDLQADIAAGTVTDAEYVKRLNALLTRFSI